jgi:hypothetical protein
MKLNRMGILFLLQADACLIQTPTASLQIYTTYSTVFIHDAQISDIFLTT